MKALLRSGIPSSLSPTFVPWDSWDSLKSHRKNSYEKYMYVKACTAVEKNLVPDMYKTLNTENYNLCFILIFHDETHWIFVCGRCNYLM